MDKNPFNYFGKLLKVSRKDRFFEVNEYLDAGYYALGDDIDGLEKMQHEDDPKPWYESDEDDSEDETEDEDTEDEDEDEESESSSFNPFEVDPDAGGSFSPAYPSSSNRRYIDSINVTEGIFYVKDTEARMDIDALEERMDDAEARLDSLEDRMDTAEADIDALEDRMDVAENDIDNLEDRMDVAENDIDNLEDRMDDAEDRLDDDESRITTLEECCEEVQDDIDGINSSITSINSSITSIKSSVSTNTTNISNLTKIINGLSLDNTTYVTKTVNVYLEAYGTYAWSATSGSTTVSMYYLRCGCNYDSLLPSGDCIITYVDGVVPNDSIQVSPLYVTGKIDLANVNTSSVLSGDYEYRIYMIGALGSLSSGSKIAECEITLGYITI